MTTITKKHIYLDYYYFKEEKKNIKINKKNKKRDDIFYL